MYFYIALLLVALSGVAAAREDVATSRDARWFLGRGIVTEVLTMKRVVTEVTPSSCVEVAPSLAPCREFRELDLHPTPTIHIIPTESATLTVSPSSARDLWALESSHEERVQPESTGGWNLNKLFDGFYRTVTRTEIQHVTARLSDAEHVITFSVVGCLPTRLPFNLDACQKSVVTPSAVVDTVTSVVGPDPRSGPI